MKYIISNNILKLSGQLGGVCNQKSGCNQNTTVCDKYSSTCICMDHRQRYFEDTRICVQGKSIPVIGY